MAAVYSRGVDGDTANDDVLASACRFLAEGGDLEEAAMLATCEIDVSFNFDETATVTIFCPRRVFDVLDSASDGPEPYMDEGWGRKERARSEIERALRAVMPPPYTLRAPIGIRARLFSANDGWRERLIDEIRARLEPERRELPASDGG
jgi:hypothetical protein